VADRYAVIGNPVTHSKSPWIHTRFALQTGEPIVYTALTAPLDGFAQAVAAFRHGGGKGANVTLPFKEEACRLAQRLSARAEAAQAVNTLAFSGTDIFGDNTDGYGLTQDLATNLGFSIAGRRVLLLGAGGAACGILMPLVEAGPGALTIVNRTVEKARALVERVSSIAIGETGCAVDAGLRASAYRDLGGERFDLIINATSAGLTDTPLDLPPDVFASAELAYDLMYGRDTAFMRQARAGGAGRVVDGLGMLVEQAAESFNLWRGVRPQTAPVLAALRTV